MINCVKTLATYDYKHGFHEEGAGLHLLKVFALTELALVLCGPIVIGLAIAVSDSAFAVAYDNKCGEAKSTSTFNDRRTTLDL